jgi:predicted nucleotidyltransferase
MQASPTEPKWAVTPEKIQKAVRWIVEAARPMRIIMFGSQAHGGASQDSDVDLMVVTAPLSDQERLQEMVRLRELLRPLRLPVDVLVVPAAKLEYWRETPGNVYYDASVDGVVLYEQGD